MKHKHLKKMLIIIIAILIWFSIVGIDYYRAKHELIPIFTYRTVGVTDGGSMIRYGIGYKVIHFNSTEQPTVRTDVVFKFRWFGAK